MTAVQTDDEAGFGLALCAIAFDAHDGYGSSKSWLGEVMQTSEVQVEV